MTPEDLFHPIAHFLPCEVGKVSIGVVFNFIGRRTNLHKFRDYAPNIGEPVLDAWRGGFWPGMGRAGSSWL